MNPVQKQTLKIGEYEILPIPTGEFALDGGAMFGTVPKVLWEKSNPPDDLNRIPMEARALLLKSKNKNILIDCGNGSDFTAKYGEKLGGKFSQMYGVNDQGVSLLNSLKKHSVNPEDIDSVILTHLHFDHAGGATCERDGKIAPTFPNAKYFIQKKNLETAQKPNIREKASYLNPNFEPLLSSGCVEIVDGNQEILPSIHTWVSNGHTKGHQCILISDKQQSLFYCGDLIPTSSHVRLAWVMGYDLEPLTLIEEKKALLERASNENWYLFFEHDPYCDAAQVEKYKEDFAVRQRFHLS